MRINLYMFSIKTHRNIATFDWDGNPKTLYQCEYDILRICVDTANDTLYAILIVPGKDNFVLASFDMAS